MPRKLTRAQRLENRAFLAALARTGNAHEAARRVGAHRAKFTRRRANHPDFATQWDAALALAHATLNSSPERGGEPLAEGEWWRGPAPQPSLRETLHRTPSGRLQLRRPGGRRRLGRAAEQAFLAALSATANIRLSAAAAGFTHAAFYAHRRRNPGFAREWRLALQMGYERLEAALLEGFGPDAYEDDDWRHNDPPPIPRMTAAEALQLLYLHQKEARLWTEPDYIKRRRGESSEAWSVRLGAIHEARLQRDREAFAVAEAARRERGWPSPFEPDPPPLPALDQVTGWSKARRSAETSEGIASAIAELGADHANARPAGGKADPSDPGLRRGRLAGFTPASGRPRQRREGESSEGERGDGIGKPALFGGWRLKDWEKGKE